MTENANESAGSKRPVQPWVRPDGKENSIEWLANALQAHSQPKGNAGDASQ